MNERKESRKEGRNDYNLKINPWSLGSYWFYSRGSDQLKTGHRPLDRLQMKKQNDLTHSPHAPR